MAGKQSYEEGLQKVHSNWFSSFHRLSRTKKNEISDPVLYDSNYLLGLWYAYKCSNQCSYKNFESGLGKHVDRKVHIMES